MATILWTTAQYSDRPVELSETPLVITQADLEKLKSSGTLFKYDSRAPLIDTKHALDSALFDFYSAIEANLAKKGSTPAAHSANHDWLQNQSEDYRAALRRP